jgi:hypothetical protein
MGVHGTASKFSRAGPSFVVGAPAFYPHVAANSAALLNGAGSDTPVGVQPVECIGENATVTKFLP